MLTCPYVFTEEQAKAMTEAGADVIVSHMGLTTSGDIGAETALDLDEASERVQAHHDAAKSVRDDVHVICHGGPIAWPDDAEYVLNNTEGIVGFFGASSIERLATEDAIEIRLASSSRSTSEHGSDVLARFYKDVGGDDAALFRRRSSPLLRH